MGSSSVPESMKLMVEHVRSYFRSEPHIADVFEKCFLNTYQSTMCTMSDGSTFVITGDIPAMWLRDSAAQVRPYLLLAQEGDEELLSAIGGVIRRQMGYINLDVYANAFNKTANGHGHHTDATEMSPYVWERKYEVDSLCYPIHLGYLLWKATGNTNHLNEVFRQSATKILETWRVEQHHERVSRYRFERVNGPQSDTLSRGGLGNDIRYTGMTWSGFRPSDDACAYGYHIPSNMFAVVALRNLTEIALEVFGDVRMREECERLANEIKNGIETYGTLIHPKFGKIYVYETDGLGNYLLMDDANVPSLLSAPYIGYCSFDDPVYLNTRRFILSTDNPYFYEGSEACGIGSPHTPQGYIWPIALAMQGLTSTDAELSREMIDVLIRTDGGTEMMHESFDSNQPDRYTRPWFSWSNMMFCELVLATVGLVVRGSPLDRRR